jgi:hypothetical protein
MRTTSGTASLAFKMSNVEGEEFFEYFKEHPEEFPKNHDGIRDFGDFALNWKEYGDFYFPQGGASSRSSRMRSLAEIMRRAVERRSVWI